MSNVSTEGLPVEMQQRIAEIIEKAKANAIQPVTQQAPVAPPQQGLTNPGALAQRPPSLMDHIIALRQEVDQLRNEVRATAQVAEAVGQAVGSMYQMFQAETQPTNYSSQFQEAAPSQIDDF